MLLQVPRRRRSLGCFLPFLVGFFASLAAFAVTRGHGRRR